MQPRGNQTLHLHQQSHSTNGIRSSSLPPGCSLCQHLPDWACSRVNRTNRAGDLPEPRLPQQWQPSQLVCSDSDPLGTCKHFLLCPEMILIPSVGIYHMNAPVPLGLCICINHCSSVASVYSVPTILYWLSLYSFFFFSWCSYCLVLAKFYAPIIVCLQVVCVVYIITDFMLGFPAIRP